MNINEENFKVLKSKFLANEDKVLSLLNYVETGIQICKDELNERIGQNQEMFIKGRLESYEKVHEYIVNIGLTK